MRPTRLLAPLLAALALSSSGCLVFEKQTIVVAFDSDKDEASAVLVYEGLQVGGDKDEDVKNANKTLESLFDRNEGFILAHPFLGIELTEYELKPGEKDAEKKKKSRDFLRRHLSLGKSAFFLNKEGELCAVQNLAVKEVKLFVAGLNEQISASLAEETEAMLKDARKRGKLDLDTLQLRQKAIKDRHAWLKVEPGRISATIIGSRKYLEDLKRETANDAILSEVRSVLAPPKPGQPPADPAAQLRKLGEKMREAERLAEFIAQTPWSVEHRKDRMTISLGLGDGEPIRFLSPFIPDKKGRTQPVLEHGKTLKVEMLKDTSAESVIADFLKKHARK